MLHVIIGLKYFKKNKINNLNKKTMAFINSLFIIFTSLFNLYMFMRWSNKTNYDMIFRIFLFCLTVFGVVLVLKNLSII